MLKLDKANYDLLPEDFKKQYKAEGDGYVLIDMPQQKISEDEFDKMRRGKDRANEERKAAQKQLDELKNKLDDESTDDLRKKGDIETLDKSWKEKFATQDKENADKLSKKDSFIEKTLVDSVAATMAAEISDTPNVILPHIIKRLKADMAGEEPQTIVLDAKGERSALSLTELKKEFVDNKDFSAIINGSKASGGGASTKKNKDGSAKTLSDMSATEEAKFANEEPDAYKRMLAAETS